MRLLYFALFSTVFFSCNLINPDEQEPSYIILPSFKVITTDGQGTASSAISELWVYANADIEGVYDAPAEVPVLKTGNNRVTVFAGIKNNGMGATRIRYPFYAAFDTVLNLQPLEHYSVVPKFTYVANAVIDDTRNFESGNTFQAGPNNQGVMQIINNSSIAVDGNKCAKASLTAAQSYMSFIDVTNLEMASGNTVFLEMNYSCNNTFILGVYAVQNGSSTKSPIIYLTPTDGGDGSVPQWNKIYLDMGAVANENLNSDYFRLYFECTSSESSTPTLYFDNLKIVHW